MDKILNLEQLKELIKSTKFTRPITELHIHHTWSPTEGHYKVSSGYRVGDYNGTNADELQQNMRDYHIRKGYFDIAQHLTLLPDGLYITGRDFNKDPASIKGWNEGAFAIEMLGNFDKGYDVLDGEQLDSITSFCAWFIDYFKRPIKAIKFHRDNPTAGKTCPGSGIDKNWFISLVKLAGGNLMICKDEAEIPEWAKDDIARVLKAGIMNGDKTGKFRPNDYITRAEAAVVARNIVKYITGKDIELK